MKYPFHSAIASQDGLSAMEVEMKKLEGIVKEIVDELGYLKERETKFQLTNGTYHNRYLLYSEVPNSETNSFISLQRLRMNGCRILRC